MTHPARDFGTISIAVAAAWLAALLAPGASASDVKDVRLGLHPSYSRVVIELDGPAAYRLERGAEGVVEVSVEASARPRTLSLASGTVASVRVEPGPQGALASIQLRDAQAQVRQRMFSDPPRIVLDFRPGAPDQAGAPPIPPAAKAPSQPPTPGARAPESAREERLSEVPPLPPVAAQPIPPQVEVNSPQKTSLIKQLVIGCSIGLVLALLVVRLIPHPQRELPRSAKSSARRPEPRPEAPKRRVQAALKARAESARERPALQKPPPGLRETPETPARSQGVEERVRQMAEEEDRASSSDAPSSGTTMTSMTRER